MKILVPTIEVRVEAFDLAPRPETLAGLRLGFLDSYASRGPDGRVTMYELMAELEPLLERRCELADISWTRKPNIAKAAEPGVIDAFARATDVAVVGECASGSSVYATVHDAVELERRGIPTITICHHHLEPVARRHGRELGLGELPLLVEPAAANAIVPRPEAAFVRTAFVEVVKALTRGEGV